VKSGATSPTWTGVGLGRDSASCPEFKPDFAQESAIRERANAVVSLIFIGIQEKNALNTIKGLGVLKGARVLQSILTRKTLRPSIGNSTPAFCPSSKPV
jgi:hypothetical protein